MHKLSPVHRRRGEAERVEEPLSTQVVQIFSESLYLKNTEDLFTVLRNNWSLWEAVSIQTERSEQLVAQNVVQTFTFPPGAAASLRSGTESDFL